ncbi:MAG: hypothetical protein ABSG70_13405 [Terriglobales bacterium]|jgi:hypothetical protein
MTAPAIITRNPKVVQRKRLWNQARRDAVSRLYVVVRACPGDEGEWEGLPNLEVLEGGAAAAVTSRKKATFS